MSIFDGKNRFLTQTQTQPVSQTSGGALNASLEAFSGEAAMGASTNRRVACILVLDTSGSMSGRPITDLNSAFGGIQQALQSIDVQTRACLEFCVIEYNTQPRMLTNGFQTIDQLQVPEMQAGGLTNMHAAIKMAYEEGKRKTNAFNTLGYPCFMPWIFLMTDGMPTDGGTPIGGGGTDGSEIIAFVQEKIQNKRISFYGVGTGDYDREFMKKLCQGAVLFEADTKDFASLFNWIARSAAVLSASKPGQQVNVAPPENVQTIALNMF